jgi:hypothetical protein
VIVGSGLGGAFAAHGLPGSHDVTVVELDARVEEWQRRVVDVGLPAQLDPHVGAGLGGTTALWHNALVEIDEDVFAKRWPFPKRSSRRSGSASVCPRGTTRCWWWPSSPPCSWALRQPTSQAAAAPGRTRLQILCGLAKIVGAPWNASQATAAPVRRSPRRRSSWAARYFEQAFEYRHSRYGAERSKVSSGAQPARLGSGRIGRSGASAYTRRKASRST